MRSSLGGAERDDGQHGTQIQTELNRLLKIRKKAVGGELAVLYSTNQVYAQERAGGGGKYKSILVLNSASSTRTVTLQTSWVDTTLVDLFATSSPHNMLTDSNGVVTLTLPGQTARIYSIYEALTEINAP